MKRKLMVVQSLTTDEINDFFDDKDTIIIFDTSFWLDIYRNLPDVVFNLYNLLSNPQIYDKTYIPFWVSKEFDKNYQKAEAEYYSLVANIKNSLQSIIIKFSKSLNDEIEQQKERHKIKDASIDKKIISMLQLLEKTIESAFDKTETQILLENDVVFVSDIKTMFNSIVRLRRLDLPSPDFIYETISEGEKRYKNKMPPGYKDEKKKKKGGNQFSDLIIWKEMISYSFKNKKNILFITNDEKEDWFDNNGFHKKLQDEFKRETLNKIVGIRGRDFIQFANAKILGGDILTDIDTYIKNRISKFSSNIYSKVFDFICDELQNERNQIYNAYKILSEYDGQEYEFEDLLKFELKDSFFDRYEGVATIYLEYEVQFSVNTCCYWGRDDDTKEVVLSPTRKHIVNGNITVCIEKVATEFLFDLNNYENIWVEHSKMEEKEYDDGLRDENEYGTYGNCPKCGDVLDDNNYGGDGFCCNCVDDDI